MAGGRSTTPMVTCTTGTFALVGVSWSLPPSSSSPGKRRKRKKRRKRLVPLQILRVAALVVDSGSGMLAMLVFRVMLLYALCSLRSSSGLRCSASWPVWTRTIFREFGALTVDSGSGMSLAGFTGLAPRDVLLSVVALAPDVRHHGRYRERWHRGVREV